jgi:hypothetical protein
VETPRRLTRKLVRDASVADDQCFCIVHDIRVARAPSPGKASSMRAA